jgi:transcriptional repressor NF-X1
VTESPPSYVCFCGKMVEPAYNRNDVPHTCGEVCGRSKKNVNPGEFRGQFLTVG